MALSRGNVNVIPRPDLSDLASKLMTELTPVDFIWEKIAPELLVGVQGSTLYYAKWYDFFAAQAGRTQGQTITSNLIGNTHTTYFCPEIISRQAASVEQIQMMGGPVAAETVLTRAGLRTLGKSIEASFVNALNLGSATDISASDQAVVDGILEAVANMLPKVMGIPGKMTLFGGSAALNVLRNNSVIGNRMKNIGFGGEASTAADSRRISNSALAQTLNVEQVLEGANAFWSPMYVVVAYAPDAASQPVEEPQFARFLRYKESEQTNTITVVEGFDYTINADFLDFKTYGEFLVLNSELIAPLKIDAIATT